MVNFLDKILKIDIEQVFIKEFFTKCCKNDSFANLINIRLVTDNKELKKSILTVYHKNDIVFANNLSIVEFNKKNNKDNYFDKTQKFEYKISGFVNSYLKSNLDEPKEVVDDLVFMLHSRKLIDVTKIKIVCLKDNFVCNECFTHYNLVIKFYYDDVKLDEIKYITPFVGVNDIRILNNSTELDELVKNSFRYFFFKLIKNKISSNSYECNFNKKNLINSYQNRYICDKENFTIFGKPKISFVDDSGVSLHFLKTSAVTKEFFNKKKLSNIVSLTKNDIFNEPIKVDCCIGLLKGVFKTNALTIYNNLLNKHDKKELLFIFSGKIYYITSISRIGDVVSFDISYHSSKYDKKINCLNLKSVNLLSNKKTIIDNISKALEETQFRF